MRGMEAVARSGMRMTAEERRESVIAAALVEFATGGLAGTSTEAIAVRAGISQPYLFRLFPTKKDLFLAVVERTFDRIVQTFERAAEGLEGEEALEAMGLSYAGLLEDRNILLVQHHAYAASSDLEVRTFVRRRYSSLWNWIADRTGVPAVELQEFFAMGMLFNVAVALDLGSLEEPWAKELCAVTALEQLASGESARSSTKQAEPAGEPAPAAAHGPAA
jgi:AcrR family transcriptional regulator